MMTIGEERIHLKEEEKTDFPRFFITLGLLIAGVLLFV